MLVMDAMAPWASPMHDGTELDEIEMLECGIEGMELSDKNMDADVRRPLLESQDFVVVARWRFPAVDLSEVKDKVEETSDEQLPQSPRHSPEKAEETSDEQSQQSPEKLKVEDSPRHSPDKFKVEDSPGKLPECKEESPKVSAASSAPLLVSKGVTVIEIEDDETDDCGPQQLKRPRLEGAHRHHRGSASRSAAASPPRLRSMTQHLSDLPPGNV